ncbi:MAG: DUF202 domain-containing protein [Candidatus Pacebacteria bacterium]|nr:DUF202 domain-containing protein [Candidatus Paceibacterota bacterium]
MAPSPNDVTTLAVERTALANERTFLAYVRTAVSIAALGILALHFLGDVPSTIFGFASLTLSAFIFALGFWRFKGERARLRNS